MARTLWMAVRILLVLTLITIAFGTIVPSNREATPYLSALSNVAVGTAEAIPCNFKRCQGNSCVFFEQWGCGFHGGQCASTACFP
jgi:hypothetical protein